MWSDIKEQVPEATLDICYGWDLFDRAYGNNAERMAWKERVNKLMEQDGITHHGRIGQKELRELRKKAGILAYPTDFTEIFMIGAVEAQRDGLVPVVINLAALDETVGTGIKIEGDIYDPQTQEEFKHALIGVMNDEDYFQEESKKAIEFASKYGWTRIAGEWAKHFI